MSTEKWMRLRKSGLEVDRMSFLDMASKARNGKIQSPWSVEVRVGMKTDQSDAFAEINSGAAVLAGTDSGHSYGGVVPADYRGWVEKDMFPLTVQQVLGAATTSSNLIRIIKETAETDNSAPVLEGEAPSTTLMTMTPQDSVVVDTVATMTASENMLNDSPTDAFEFLTRRLTRLVGLKEETDLITGDGSSKHMVGLQHVTGVNPINLSTFSGNYDEALLRAIELNFLDSGIWSTFFLVSPATFFTLSIGMGTGSGLFLSGGTAPGAPRTRQGLQVAVSTKVPDSLAFVGSRETATRYVRSLEIQKGVQGSQFAEGLVTVRAKLRSALTIEQPASLTVITL